MVEKKSWQTCVPAVTEIYTVQEDTDIKRMGDKPGWDTVGIERKNKNNETKTKETTASKMA